MTQNGIKVGIKLKLYYRLAFLSFASWFNYTPDEKYSYNMVVS